MKYESEGKLSYWQVIVSIDIPASAKFWNFGDVIRNITVVNATPVKYIEMRKFNHYQTRSILNYFPI